ncbi:MAG: pyridoxal 5'-phosphate synthase glutaminase subunit PdxT [Clostridium sp.]|nr:pyridoxal 5'-phosphate synthase glutaminase subunit PdxT [Clostridium sp.]
MKIGVLAIQGGFIEHAAHIKSLGAQCVEVRNAEDTEDIDGLILPGGESTAISKILVETENLNPLKEKIKNGVPVWGTCAGLILLAKKIENEKLINFNAMDITVRRNAYGRQIDSFRTEAVINEVSERVIPLVFIRAPFITGVKDDVEVMCKVRGNIVAARQNNMLATSFHPELTENLEFHKYFLNMCR